MSYKYDLLPSDNVSNGSWRSLRAERRARLILLGLVILTCTVFFGFNWGTTEAPTYEETALIERPLTTDKVSTHVTPRPAQVITLGHEPTPTPAPIPNSTPIMPPKSSPSPLSPISQTILDNIFPVDHPNGTDLYQEENYKALRTLMRCMVQGDCHENQAKVVLLNSLHFANSIEGHVSGEDIWAGSAIAALREMNHTFLYSRTTSELLQHYSLFPSLVKTILVEGAVADSCLASPDCIKTPQNPTGLPLWKLFSFHFWTGSAHPLGNAWTLSPENFSSWTTNSDGNFYLGYSVERTCSGLPVVPDEEREHRAYLLGKQSRYFEESTKEYAWPGMSFDKADLGVQIVAGADGTLPVKGVTNLGSLNKSQFYAELAKSKVLIGAGLPWLSPSPYDALCMGVPFVNPIVRWDEKAPEDRGKWETQHNGLREVGEPWVYHVRKGDAVGLREAVEKAVRNPIERYIPPAMTMEAFQARLSDLIGRDWRHLAEKLLEERKAFGKGEIFEL